MKHRESLDLKTYENTEETKKRIGGRNVEKESRKEKGRGAGRWNELTRADKARVLSPLGRYRSELDLILRNRSASAGTRARAYVRVPCWCTRATLTARTGEGEGMSGAD